MHARTVRVEDAGDLDIELVLAVIVEEQRFGAALALVVAAARPDWIDAAQVAFSLRMHFGVAVAFTRLASPSMLIAPCTDVFVVCTGSNW